MIAFRIMEVIHQGADYVRLHDSHLMVLPTFSRKMHAYTIEALSASCSKHSRQVHQAAASSLDPAIVQLEFGLVDIFPSLCSFEWTAGYREVTTALL